MANTNEYMRKYMIRRYHERRKMAIDLLGGKCTNCGSTENLNFDHIDPLTKSFSLSKMWSISLKRFLDELGKCQVLCEDCHKEKHAPKDHGTLSMYRYCKCDLCRKAFNAYMLNWKRNQKNLYEAWLAEQ